MTQQGPGINQLGANMAGFFSNIDSIAVSLFVDILIDLLTNISDGNTDIETRCLVYDKESDHSYKAVRTCPQKSDG